MPAATASSPRPSSSARWASAASMSSVNGRNSPVSVSTIDCSTVWSSTLRPSPGGAPSHSDVSAHGCSSVPLTLKRTCAMRGRYPAAGAAKPGPTRARHSPGTIAAAAAAGAPAGAAGRPGLRRRVRQVAADVADVQAARDVARAVGDMQVDPGDEAGARAGADRDVRAEVEARAVVDGRVAVGVAVAGELGDVGAPGQAEGGRCLGERGAEARRVGVEGAEPVEALERVEDVGRPAERAVGGRLEGRAREREVAEALVGALDRLEHGRRRRLAAPVAGALVGTAAGLGERRAQARDRLAVALGALEQLLDLAQEVLAVGADRLELAEQRLVRRQPLVRGLAAGRRRRGVLGLVAALRQALLGPGGARFGPADLGVEPRRPARLLVALGLGRLAAA